MIKNVTPEIAHEWFEKDEACIIDVRELSEHQAQSIKGSFLIPSGEIDAKKIPSQYRDKKIILHCQRGGRSSRSCKRIKEEDDSLDLYNLEGGILSWHEKGFETILGK